MESWRTQLRYDPVPPLLSSGEALHYFVNRDLLNEQIDPITRVWELPGAQKILRNQRDDGSWKHPGKNTYPAMNYSLIETWKQFRYLVETYGFTKENVHVKKASEFIFSCQSEEGDIRGMIGNQYATYYTGALMALLIQAGYQDDPRTEKGFQWLLSVRQDDGGWSIPLITRGFKMQKMVELTTQDCDPVPPDQSKPFSHNATGMVLRAFAVHEDYRKSEAAKKGADLLKSRFFQPDAYTSYHDARHWVRFQYPFWWNNVVSALDSLSLIGISREDTKVREGLQWLIAHQEESGLWKVSYWKDTENTKSRETRLWVSLAVCRVFKRFYG